MKKRICAGGVFVFLFLGMLFALAAPGEMENREVEAIQDAIRIEKLPWRAAATPLSFMSREQRLRRLGGRLSEVPVFVPAEHFPRQLALPAALDWRDHGGNWISSVKDQGDCGSCWAFAASAVLESMVKISKNMGEDIDLSEQTLVSCSGAGDCVDGGSDYLAAEYIRTTGVPREICFPYSASDELCNPCTGWLTRVVKIRSWDWVATTVTGPVEVVSSPSRTGPSPPAFVTGRRVASMSASGSTETSTRSLAGKGCPHTSQASPAGWTFSQSEQEGIAR